MKRCKWCEINEKMIKCHDEEWGIPLHDDKKQFEFLILEVMQCGLNWNMMIKVYSHLQSCGIINDHVKECFDGFDFNKIASYDENDIERILKFDGMIKSRRKIEAVINNARHFLEML